MNPNISSLRLRLCIHNQRHFVYFYLHFIQFRLEECEFEEEHNDDPYKVRFDYVITEEEIHQWETSKRSNSSFDSFHNLMSLLSFESLWLISIIRSLTWLSNIWTQRYVNIHEAFNELTTFQTIEEGVGRIWADTLTTIPPLKQSFEDYKVVYFLYFVFDPINFILCVSVSLFLSFILFQSFIIFCLIVCFCFD